MKPSVLPHFELRDLLFFETIAELSHLGQAAQRLHRTQSALSQCVRRLEQGLDAQLFERLGRGIRLTPAGAVLLKRVRVLRRAAEDTVREMDDFEHGRSGHVRVGCGPITAERLLPAVCRQLMAQGEDVTVEVVTGWNAELLGLLKTGRLDLVVGPVPETGDDLVSLPWGEDVFVVAASARHEIFRKRSIKLRHLLAYRWVLPTRQAHSRQWLDRLFELRGLSKPTVQIEANTISLLSSVIAGTGLISFMSRDRLRTHQGLATLREVSLTEATLRRQLGVTWQKDAYLSPAALRLVEVVKAGKSSPVPP